MTKYTDKEIFEHFGLEGYMQYKLGENMKIEVDDLLKLGTEIMRLAERVHMLENPLPAKRPKGRPKKVRA